MLIHFLKCHLMPCIYPTNPRLSITSFILLNWLVFTLFTSRIEVVHLDSLLPNFTKPWYLNYRRVGRKLIDSFSSQSSLASKSVRIWIRLVDYTFVADDRSAICISWGWKFKSKIFWNNINYWYLRLIQNLSTPPLIC